MLEFLQPCFSDLQFPMGRLVRLLHEAVEHDDPLATLECELIDRRSWKTKAEPRTALFTWIEGWYNPRRLHSSLGYLSPTKYEEEFAANNDRAPSTGLPTAALRSSQATHAAVDNPAPVKA